MLSLNYGDADGRSSAFHILILKAAALIARRLEKRSLLVVTLLIGRFIATAEAHTKLRHVRTA
jgi:hypothetical protein